MTLNVVDRARIIMDLVQDGDVATEANYASPDLDFVDGPTALKYAQAFWDVGAGVAVDPENPTNDELATNYMNAQREFHRSRLAASRAPALANQARVDEIAVVDGEVETDLGTDE